MVPQSGSLGDTLLHRLDQWSARSKWLPAPDEWFPNGVFWGVFLWNLPILLLAVGAIGAVMYRSDPDSSGFGFFTSLNWIVELTLGTVTLATLVDAAGCLWIRRLWNKRARWLRRRAEKDARRDP